MNFLKKFNLICEEQERKIICEGGFLNWFKNATWSLEEEFKVILKSIQVKVESAFINIKDHEPGKLELSGDPIIIPINEGTSSPGFKAIYYINDDYVKNQLFPFLKKLESFITLNNKYHFFEQPEPYNAQLIIEVNAKSDDFDLANSEIKIPALSIKKWEGNLYFNFKCEGIDREKSNILITNSGNNGINVTVTADDYKSIADKVLDILNKTSSSNYIERNGINKTLGNALAFDMVKQTRSKKYGKIPNATIKCVIQLNTYKFFIKDTIGDDKDDKKSNDKVNTNKQVYKKVDKTTGAEYISKIYNFNPILNEMDQSEFNENILKTIDLTTSISPDIFNNEEVWTTAEKHVEIYESLNEPVTENYFNTAKTNVNEYICCKLQPTYLNNSNKKFNKTIQIFLYIIDFKNSNNGKDLFNTRFDSPIFKIIITDNDTDNVLYERYYNVINFKKAEPNIYKILKSEIEKLKYK